MDELLKENGLKVTKQRKIVIDLIASLKESATAKNVANKCKKDVDNSTVYRIIDLLVLKDILEKRVNYNEEIYYAIKEKHGHYFNCVKCHKMEKIEECPIEDLEIKYENEKGYEILSHTILINGICRDCKNTK